MNTLFFLPLPWPPSLYFSFPLSYLFPFTLSISLTSHFSFFPFFTSFLFLLSQSLKYPQEAKPVAYPKPSSLLYSISKCHSRLCPILWSCKICRYQLHLVFSVGGCMANASLCSNMVSPFFLWSLRLHNTHYIKTIPDNYKRDHNNSHCLLIPHWQNGDFFRRYSKLMIFC